MKRSTSHRRTGNIVVLSAFLMALLMALAAFAVDIGYIADAKTEMQRSADAAALAGAARLPSLGAAQAAAIGCASENMTSISPALKAGDIKFGYWDRDTLTFYYNPKPAGRPYNAIQVTLRRTEANGNALNLFFGRILGKEKTDVMATAIAFGDRGLCGPFIGIEEVKAGGDLRTDSFDSWDGTYDVTTSRDQGSLCSDGPITVGGNADIHGDVRAGKDETVTVNGSSADISGEIGNRLTSLELPSVDADAASGNNNNSSLVRYRNPLGGGWIDPINNQGDFRLEGGAVYTLPPGTYYIDDMTMVGGSQLIITGKTTIYVTGTLDFHGGSSINNTTELANNLWINMTGPGNAKINGGSEFYGVVYAPDSDVAYAGGADYYGAIVAKTLTVSGNAVAHYDESLDVNLGAYALRVMLVD